jgi:hypothetical protein
LFCAYEVLAGGVSMSLEDVSFPLAFGMVDGIHNPLLTTTIHGVAVNCQPFVGNLKTKICPAGRRNQTSGTA